jgi:serine/threonine protein kinase
MKRGIRTRRTKGGVEIGKGAYGVVYTKPDDIEKLLPEGCEWKDGYVMKVVTDKDKEWEKTQILRDNAVKGAIYPESTCTLKDKRTALFSKFGGQSLLELFYSTGPILNKEQLETAKKNADFYFEVKAVVVRNREMINAVVDALEALKPQIQTMNKLGIFHTDIHEGNIVYDGKDTYLIDFGTIIVRKRDTKRETEAIDYIIEKLTKPTGGSRKRAVTSKRRTRRRRSYRSR